MSPRQLAAPVDITQTFSVIVQFLNSTRLKFTKKTSVCLFGETIRLMRSWWLTTGETQQQQSECRMLQRRPPRICRWRRRTQRAWRTVYGTRARRVHGGPKSLF